MKVRPIPGRMTKRRAAATSASIALAVFVSGCSGASASRAASSIAHANRAPLPGSVAHLVMTDATAGWAVWPSGDAWVLLRTTDGWQHVTNATPIAVPTGGGLVVAGTADDVAVAVEPYDQLTRSPVLTKNSANADWSPAELPGAVADARAAIATSATRTTAVLLGPTGGTVVSEAGNGWTTLTAAATLAPDSNLRLDGITWANDSLGWLTGHAFADTPVAFQTTDGGRSWTAVARAVQSAVAALAPCGADTLWLLPVIGSDGKITIERTADDGNTWVPGTSLTLPSGPPVWGCGGSEIWVAGRVGHSDHILASADGGATWQDRGPAPHGLTDLTPVGNGVGFAVSETSKGQTLWDVADNGGRFTPRPLPDWVATLGATMSTS